MSNELFRGEFVDSNRILYTPSEFARTNLFYLQESGCLHARKPHISQRQNLMSYLFFYLTDGSGILNYDGKEYLLRRGDCVFINCQTPYFHQSSEDLWSLHWIHFYGPTIHSIYLKYTERGGQPVFHPANLQEFDDIWQHLYHIASSSDFLRDMRINEYLFSLLTLVMEQSWNPEAKLLSFKQHSLIDVKEYIDANYADKITLDRLSEMFSINKFYLERIFKEQFGVSIINYLTNIRITHAKRLLRFTDKSIEQVGADCGITPLYYFSRMFKQTEGISPSEYRMKWK